MGYTVFAGWGYNQENIGDVEEQSPNAFDWFNSTPGRLEAEAVSMGLVSPLEPLVGWSGHCGESLMLTDGAGKELPELLIVEAFILRARYYLKGRIPEKPIAVKGKSILDATPRQAASVERTVYEMMEMCQWVVSNRDKPLLKFYIF